MFFLLIKIAQYWKMYRALLRRKLRNVFKNVKVRIKL